jgi:capsid assembly protease
MTKKAFTLAQDVPWAITEAGLRQILLIANREQLDIEAVEAQLGRKLANTQSVTERDGVAVLPINGPLARHANLFTAISGATSIELLARDFTAALNNSSVRAILLNIDSPGGEVNGTDEFAGMVFLARGVKPIYAYIGGTGCSAAYWIASACDQVVCAPTAVLGSIGIIAAVPDPGVESAGDIEFVSSQSPRKNPDPRSDEGKSSIQATIDSLAQVFVETVARNRGVSAEAVLSSFGQGGVFVGAEAVAAGLADRTGSYEDVLAQLAGRQQGTTQRMAAAPSQSFDILATSTPLADVQRVRASVLSAPRAHVPAPVDTNLVPKEHTAMSDQDIPAGAVDPTALPPITPPTFSASDPAVTAQVNAVVAQMTAQFEQQRQIVLEQAQAQFQRQLAEMQAQQAIQTYAQHITTPTMQRPHALPFTGAEIITVLSSLNASQRTAVQGLLDRVLDSGLVSFEEIGSSGDSDARNEREQYQALVSEKVKGGMSRLEAIKSVNREHPALYAAQSNPKGGR